LGLPRFSAEVRAQPVTRQFVYLNINMKGACSV